MTEVGELIDEVLSNIDEKDVEDQKIDIDDSDLIILETNILDEYIELLRKKRVKILKQV